MKTLSLVYITSRYEPHVEWFLDSLYRQPGGKECEVIIVDPHRPESSYGKMRVVNPKPCVWQGPHRLTKQDWWAASNARNSGICLCDTEWIGFVDDRSILLPHWLEAVADAMNGEYAVCGPYEKVHNLEVESGKLACYTPTHGKDNRLVYVEENYLQHKHLSNPYDCPGSWWYGCSTALPLEWALRVNGYDETCDGLGAEDSIFGLMLEANGLPIRYDTRLAIIEDRTPGHLGPVMHRKDKGVSPDDKSHWLLNKLKTRTRALHQWDLRQMRAVALAGKGFPVSSWPNRDPYDNQPLSEMTPC